MTTRVLFLVPLLFLAQPRSAEAHAVGLSRGTYQVDGRRVTAELTIARAEAWSPEPSRLPQYLAIRGDGEPCSGVLEVAPGDGTDAVFLRGAFECPRAPATVAIELLLLDELAPGHRHLAKLSAGSSSAEGVLFRGQAKLELEVSAGTLASFEVTRRMVALGVEHILTGYDHLAFLLGLVLAARRIRGLLGVVTAFTLAHSVTLAAAVLGLVAPSPDLVEPAIAATIAYVGIENLLRGLRGVQEDTRWIRRRIATSFALGLVHGFGFAGALAETGLPSGDVPLALATFNLGVEAGQLGVLALFLPVLSLLRARPSYERRLAPLASAGVALAGLVWLVARIRWLALLAVVSAALPACHHAPAKAPEPAIEVGGRKITSVYAEDPARPDPLAERLCTALHTLPAKRKAACTSGGAVGFLPTGECTRTLSAALASGAVRLEASAVESCEAAMVAAHDGCDWMKAAAVPTPAACAEVVTGHLGAGAVCRSSLECARGLHCAGVGPTDAGRCRAPEPDNAPCGRSVDALAAWARQDGLEAAHPECAHACLRHKCRS